MAKKPSDTGLLQYTRQQFFLAHEHSRPAWFAYAGRVCVFKAMSDRVVLVKRSFSRPSSMPRIYCFGADNLIDASLSFVYDMLLLKRESLGISAPTDAGAPLKWMKQWQNVSGVSNGKAT